MKSVLEARFGAGKTTQVAGLCSDASPAAAGQRPRLNQDRRSAGWKVRAAGLGSGDSLLLDPPGEQAQAQPEFSLPRVSACRRKTTGAGSASPGIFDRIHERSLMPTWPRR